MSEIVSSNFIEEFINKDLEEGKNGGKIHTRFPPEPNGYLHIGHAKAICINFSIAEKYNGKYNLRFDDTNPAKEDMEYVDSITEDIKWLGFDINEGNTFYASSYFEKMYECAVNLIEKGLAFVCDLNADEMREYRGTLTETGKNSPYRDRSVEENLAMFEDMRAGKYVNGEKSLRAKIDMSSPNINMRDPVIYRIVHIEHHQTGKQWCIYPMYDFAHPLEDAFENITHSLCSMEFEDHRPFYDWVIANAGVESTPRQIEFARLNMTYTLLSKRYLLRLVKEDLVDGWDDPRMPTISGFRRRGYTPEAIRKFLEAIGVSKSISVVDFAFLEHFIRDEMNAKAKRVMAVLDPIKVTIENYPEGQIEEVETENNPEDETAGTRKVPFSREIYIERDDFIEVPPNRKYFRLYPGNEVRLKSAYYITCKDVIKDENGEVKELICTYDPDTKGGTSPDGRKVRGTIHWVSANDCIDAEVRLYENIFNDENPQPSEETFADMLNPDSLKIISNAKVEKVLGEAKVGDFYQFMRTGYFCVDSKNFEEGKLVFNRTVALKDSWGKIANKQNS